MGGLIGIPAFAIAIILGKPADRRLTRCIYGPIKDLNRIPPHLTGHLHWRRLILDANSFRKGRILRELPLYIVYTDASRSAKQRKGADYIPIDRRSGSVVEVLSSTAP